MKHIINISNTMNDNEKIMKHHQQGVQCNQP